MTAAMTSLMVIQDVGGRFVMMMLLLLLLLLK